MITLNESILGSTKSGKTFYDSKIIEGLKNALSYLTKYHALEVEIKQLPKHSKPTIVLTYGTESSCYFNFNQHVVECLPYFKYYDGIIRECPGCYYMASGFCFDCLDNVSIDLSSFDYTYSEYLVEAGINDDNSDGITVDFINCKNVSIDGLPKYRARNKFSMLFSNTALASTITLPKNTCLHINCDGITKFVQKTKELELFSNMNLKSLELESNYFEDDTKDAPNIFRFRQSEIRDNINEYWFPELESIVQKKIAKKLYVSNYYAKFLIQRKSANEFISIKKKSYD